MTAGCCFPALVVIYSSTEWSRNEDVSFTFILFSFAVAILLLWSHRKNIQRLKEGTESKIYIWGRPKEEEQNNKKE
jgi:glycerol-3-phosphate acyltransferase PlsY